jgi:hypothetical protein
MQAVAQGKFRIPIPKSQIPTCDSRSCGLGFSAVLRDFSGPPPGGRCASFFKTLQIPLRNT